MFVLAINIMAQAQTFSNNQGGSIPDDNSWIEFPIQVSGIGQNTGVDFGLNSVCFSISHNYVSDLQIHLVGPDGNEIVLLEGIGGDGDNFTNTVLSKNTFPFVGTGFAPFTGTFRPQQSLGLQSNGQPCDGTWKLKIKDGAVQDEGFLQNWCIIFSNDPVVTFSFSSSNLPILIINTNNEPIADEPKTPGYLQVIDNPGNQRNLITDTSILPKIPMGIELRGSSSQSFPKKSYGLETRTTVGEDSSISLLGMPSESDWILSASYSDKTFLRNALAYQTARSLGQYAPRTRFAEVFVNNEYKGIYVLTEKIKRDANRVNISRLSLADTSGTDVTGGYIIKIDKTTGTDNQGFESRFLPQSTSQGQRINFLYDYPEAEDLHPKQKEYIKSYVDSFETALNASNYTDPVLGYRKYIDLQSFLDMLLINEFSKNVDGYRISTFLTKQKITQNGGKLKAGPVWDYDLGWRNADYCDGASVSGWSFEFPTVCPDDGSQPPNWWSRFRTDDGFKSELRCRWSYLINLAFPPSRQVQWIDSVSTLLEEAQQRNFEVWPILGTYVWPNPSPIPTTYEGEIQNLKTWLQNRKQWLDSNIGGACLVGNAPIISSESIICLPNPASHTFKIQNLPAKLNRKIELFNALGKPCRNWNSDMEEFSVESLPKGMYVVRVEGFTRAIRLMME